MASINASIINLTAPYVVSQKDELTVHFVTNLGIRYQVGFTKDIFIFDENGYDFFIINENNTDIQDPLVFLTVQAIIKNLFDNAGDSAVIYICSPSDNRQAIRARLFKMWFAKSPLCNNFSLTTYHSVDNEVEYFYGLILKKDNPHHNQLIDIFMDFISDY